MSKGTCAENGSKATEMLKKERVATSWANIVDGGGYQVAPSGETLG